MKKSVQNQEEDSLILIEFDGIIGSHTPRRFFDNSSNKGFEIVKGKISMLIDLCRFFRVVILFTKASEGKSLEILAYMEASGILFDSAYSIKAKEERKFSIEAVIDDYSFISTKFVLAFFNARKQWGNVNLPFFINKEQENTFFNCFLTDHKLTISQINELSNSMAKTRNILNQDFKIFPISVSEYFPFERNHQLRPKIKEQGRLYEDNGALFDTIRKKVMRDFNYEECKKKMPNFYSFVTDNVTRNEKIFKKHFNTEKRLDWIENRFEISSTHYFLIM